MNSNYKLLRRLKLLAWVATIINAIFRVSRLLYRLFIFFWGD